MKKIISNIKELWFHLLFVLLGKRKKIKPTEPTSGPERIINYMKSKGYDIDTHNLPDNKVELTYEKDITKDVR